MVPFTLCKVQPFAKNFPISQMARLHVLQLSIHSMTLQMFPFNELGSICSYGIIASF